MGHLYTHAIYIWNIDTGLFGGFHKWGMPNSWLLYDGSEKQIDDLGVPSFLETSKSGHEFPFVRCQDQNFGPILKSLGICNPGPTQILLQQQNGYHLIIFRKSFQDI